MPNLNMAVSLTVPFCVGTLNVRGLASRRRQCQINRLLLEDDIDIMAVQETKVESEEQTDRMVEPFRNRYNVCVSHARGTSAGCIILVRKCTDIVVQTVTSSDDGRLLVIDFSFCGLLWRAICVYAPNKIHEREEYIGNLKACMTYERNIILFGDFNCVCRPQDRANRLTYRDKSALLLSTLVNEFELDDVGCIFDGDEHVQYTHYQGVSHARLDRIYVSAEITPHLTTYRVKNVTFSDHCLVTVTVGTKAKVSRFSWNLWKLNDKLLDDEIFLKKVKEKMDGIFSVETSNFTIVWEQFKNEVKIAAIERACVLRSNEKQQEKELKSTLDFMTTVESTNPGHFSKEIRDLKSKLEVIDENKYRGAMVRARAERLWLGETPTKRALGEEKRQAVKKEIKEIRYKNEATRDKELIKKAFVECYQRLLSPKIKDTVAFRNDFLSLMPRLDDEVRETLERPISLHEVEQAIDELSTGKAPGPDGLGAAIYKTFKKELAQALHRVIDECYDRKRAPLSFRKCHVVLIPKSDDPRKLMAVEAYRPISLTNVDYKIFTKVLAKRLQSVITHLVLPHQTCGIKGRTIYTNIHTARTILECCDINLDNIAMIQLDLQKAFDRVNHDILLSVLEHCNVGSVITKGIKMVYEECAVNLIINNTLSENIPVLSGIKQGCACSSLLFALYLEPLCLKILRNERVHGYSYYTSEVKILAYADDIAIFCRDKDSVKEAVKEATAFCSATGSAISWDKSLGIWHGNWGETPETYANMRWTNIPASYLGVPLQHYRNTTEYWAGETDRLKDQSEKWGGHNFSMFSRATVCNVFFVAKVFYVLQVFSMSRICVQKLHRVFATYIWNSTWERTSRSNLFLSMRNGGLGLCHLFLKQIVSRFFFLRDQRDIFLSAVIHAKMCNHIPEYIVSSNAETRGTLSSFWREIVSAYQVLKSRFSLEYLGTVARKRLYKDLLDVFLPIPLYRSIYQLGQERDVLKRVRKMPVRASSKTFFLQLHTGTLPVKPWLESKGIFVPWGLHCLICQKTETIEHIFLDCHDAVFLWDILQRTVKKELPVSPFGIRFLPCADTEDVPCDMLMLLCLHSVWKTRMAVRNADINARSAVQNFIEHCVYVRDVLKIQRDPPDWLPVLDKLASLRPF